MVRVISNIQLTKAYPSDAGWDLFATAGAEWVVEPNVITIIPTGLKLAIPEGYYGQILDRSGLAAKGFKVMGGVIDSGYRDEIKVIMTSLGGRTLTNVDASKIAQIVFLPCGMLTQVGDVCVDSARGISGFGSSGL